MGPREARPDNRLRASPDDASHRRANHEAPAVAYILRDARFAGSSG